MVLSNNQDPLGQAILDFVTGDYDKNITVASDLCEDDVIPVEYLFRTIDTMPTIELEALRLTKGRVLDVGAGAGCHAVELTKMGFDVTAIDISEGACNHLAQLGIAQQQIEFLQFTSSKKFDTILFLMNGIGIAGHLDHLEEYLIHAKSLLNPGGQILLDSTDISYLFEEEDGSMWIDLNTTYFGHFQFQMSYKQSQTPWFDWLYVDFNTLREKASLAGLACTLSKEEETHFLARLTITDASN